MSISTGINKIKYYISRNGFLYMLARRLCHLGLLDKNLVDGNLFLTGKFYRYFEELSPEKYEEELAEQLKYFWGEMGLRCNLKNPVTYNEKIQWLKINDRNPIKSILADKVRVREWVKEVIGDDYLIPMVGGPWKRGEEIDFDSLPDQYVIKANHGSGMNYIVRDKKSVNCKKLIKYVNHWINTLVGWRGLEWQYLSIPRLVYVEKYLEQENGDLYDYKVFCFDGVAKFIRVQGDRNLQKHTGKQAFFDIEWNKMDYNPGDYPDYEYDIPKPKKLDELIAVAEKLAKGFKHVRVDLYIVDEHIYFGEMTFTPANGFFPWIPGNADEIMGEFIQL